MFNEELIRYRRNIRCARKERELFRREIGNGQYRKDDVYRASTRPLRGILSADQIHIWIQHSDGHHGWYQVPHSTFRRPWYEFEIARA